MVVSGRKLGLLAAVGLVVVAALLASCTSTSSTLTSPPTSSTVSTASPSSAEYPLYEPVDVIRRETAPWVWSAVVANQTVAYVESGSFTAPLPWEWSGPTEKAVINTLDLETGRVSAVPGSDLSSPTWQDFAAFPWWFLAGLSSAEAQATASSFVWAVCNAREESKMTRWQEVTGWTPNTGTEAVLDPETMTFTPIRTGDVLALPLTSAGYESAQGGTAGSALGEELLVLTASLGEPVAVDPAAPILSESAIEGLSPYSSWSGWLLGRRPNTEYGRQFRSDLPGQPPRVFDLRTGELVDISVEDPRTPYWWTASMVAGHWAAWVAIEGSPEGSSLYLADLLTGQARRLLDGNAPGEIAPSEIALSEDWLLWTDPSGNLLGYHLPDLEPVRVAGVLTSGEYSQNLQISGDLAVLMVVALNDPGDAIGPEYPPKWTAIRVVRLR